MTSLVFRRPQTNPSPLQVPEVAPSPPQEALSRCSCEAKKKKDGCSSDVILWILVALGIAVLLGGIVYLCCSHSHSSVQGGTVDPRNAFLGWGNSTKVPSADFLEMSSRVFAQNPTML